MPVPPAFKGAAQVWKPAPKPLLWPATGPDRQTGGKMSDGILIGGGGEGYRVKQFLDLGYANRHG